MFLSCSVTMVPGGHDIARGYPCGRPDPEHTPESGFRTVLHLTLCQNEVKARAPTARSRVVVTSARRVAEGLPYPRGSQPSSLPGARGRRVSQGKPKSITPRSFRVPSHHHGHGKAPQCQGGPRRGALGVSTLSRGQGASVGPGRPEEG